MNKQAELEQAYWNGFATKCAEYGVDATKLAQAVSQHRVAQGLGAAGAALGAVRGLVRKTGKKGRLAAILRDALVGYGSGVGAGYAGAAIGNFGKRRKMLEIQDNEDLMGQLNQGAEALYQQGGRRNGTRSWSQIRDELLNTTATAAAVPYYAGGGLAGLLGGNLLSRRITEDLADKEEPKEEPT